MRYIKFLHWKNNKQTFDFRIFPFQLLIDDKRYLSLYIGYLSTLEWHIISLFIFRFSFKKKV